MKKIKLSRKSIKSAANLPEGSDYYKWMQYDVWGNEEDGWEVNNVFPLDKKIVIHDDLTDMDILKVLCAEGILNRAYINDIDVEYYDDFIELYEKETAQPIGRLEKTDSIESSRKSIKSEMTSRQYQNAIDKAARMITEGERDVQKICKMTKLDESDVQAIIDEQDEFENEINSSHKITQSKERSIMNGAIKELEELFSTKAKGNTVYFNDVNYTPLPLPVQNAVKLIMDEYPDLRYRMGLYSVTVFDKGQSIKSSRKAIKSSNCETMNRREVDSIIWDYITDLNVVGEPEEVEFVDGSFGTVTWLDSDGDEIEVCGYEHGKPVHSSRKIMSRVTSEGSYSIFVDGTQASNEYPKPGNPVEFESEKDAKGSSLYKRLLDRYGQDHVQVIQESRNISSSGAFRDRDEDDNPECIIEILKDGKWEGVGIDKNADDGWSTNVNFTVFESEDKARKSGMARRLKNAGYSEEDGTLKFSTK